MISVVIPLYNKEASIAQSLGSVLSQSYDDFEVVLVDDGSTDGSVAVVETIHDPRIRLVRQENGGPSKARNTGVKNARGEWILFLDADDELLPGALVTFHNLCEKHPEIEMFGCSYVYKTNDEVQGEVYTFKEGILKNPYAAIYFHYYGARMGSFMCSRRVALACPFNEKIRRYEDFECLFRIYRQIKAYVLPLPVMIENRDFAEASHARKDIKEDFMGYLDFNGKSFWEKMALYALYLGERDYYPEQCRKLYPWLYRRYDWLVLYKVMHFFYN